MKIRFFCLSVFVLASSILMAQDLRSSKSGEWGDVSTWERKSGENWVAATDIPRSASNVVIRSSHEVVLTQEIGPTCSNLLIEKDAILKANGAPTLRIGTGKNATEFKLVNNGTITSGATAEDGLIRLDVFNTGQKFTISGNGVTNLGRLGVRGSNPNKIEVIIDANLNITEKTNTANFTAMDNVESRRSDADDVTITINKGKTVKIINPSTFHSPTASVEKGGKYTYNINGTLDLSENVVGNHLVPSASNAESAVVLNVKGQLILGPTFNTVNRLASTGAITLTILDGGSVDATRTKRLTLGPNQFKTEGTGNLKR